MPNQKSLGFSLLETLIALSLFSISSVLILQQQRQTLHHFQYIRYKQLATQAQQSIAERLKSCLGHTPCQQHEIHKWQLYYATHAPSLKIHYLRQENMMEIIIAWKGYKQRLVIPCDYL